MYVVKTTGDLQQRKSGEIEKRRAKMGAGKGRGTGRYGKNRIRTER